LKQLLFEAEERYQSVMLICESREREFQQLQEELKRKEEECNAFMSRVSESEEEGKRAIKSFETQKTEISTQLQKQILELVNEKQTLTLENQELLLEIEKLKKTSREQSEWLALVQQETEKKLTSVSKIHERDTEAIKVLIDEKLRCRLEFEEKICALTTEHRQLLKKQSALEQEIEQLRSDNVKQHSSSKEADSLRRELDAREDFISSLIKQQDDIEKLRKRQLTEEWDLPPSDQQTRLEQLQERKISQLLEEIDLLNAKLREKQSPNQFTRTPLSPEPDIPCLITSPAEPSKETDSFFTTALEQPSVATTGQTDHISSLDDFLDEESQTVDRRSIPTVGDKENREDNDNVESQTEEIAQDQIESGMVNKAIEEVEEAEEAERDNELLQGQPEKESQTAVLQDDSDPNSSKGAPFINGDDDEKDSDDDDINNNEEGGGGRCILS